MTTTINLILVPSATGPHYDGATPDDRAQLLSAFQIPPHYPMPPFFDDDDLTKIQSGRNVTFKIHGEIFTPHEQRLR